MYKKRTNAKSCWKRATKTQKVGGPVVKKFHPKWRKTFTQIEKNAATKWKKSAPKRKTMLPGGTKNGGQAGVPGTVPQTPCAYWCGFFLDLYGQARKIQPRGANNFEPRDENKSKTNKKTHTKKSRTSRRRKLRRSSFLQRRPGASREPSQKAASRKLEKQLFCIENAFWSRRFRTCVAHKLAACFQMVKTLLRHVFKAGKWFSIIPAPFLVFYTLFYGFEFLRCDSIFYILGQINPGRRTCFFGLCNSIKKSTSSSARCLGNRRAHLGACRVKVHKKTTTQK